MKEKPLSLCSVDWFDETDEQFSEEEKKSICNFIKFVLNEQIKNVDTPCEWETKNNKIIEDKIERVMNWWNFCPVCGRRLRERT